MNAVVGAMIDFDGNSPYWVGIDLSTMDMMPINLTAAEAFFTGGGRAGDYLYGNDVDGTFMRYLVETGSADETYKAFTVNPSYALRDAANMPDLTYEYKGETYHFTLATASVNGTVAIWEIEEGSLFYFDDIPPFVALAYDDYDVEEDGTRVLYYYAIGEDGLLYQVVFYDTADDNGDPDIGDFALPIAEIGVLNIGSALAALPLGDGLAAHADLFRQRLLREPRSFSETDKILRNHTFPTFRKEYTTFAAKRQQALRTFRRV